MLVRSWSCTSNIWGIRMYNAAFLDSRLLLEVVLGLDDASTAQDDQVQINVTASTDNKL